MADEQTRGYETDVKTGAQESEEIVVPLLIEELSVSKRLVPKARVQISRVTRQREEVVDELLARERLEVERCAIGQLVESVPEVREEGDTIIVPVVEEILTVERRLCLKEEIRIRRIRETEHHQERVTLRRQEAVMVRLPVEDSAA